MKIGYIGESQRLLARMRELQLGNPVALDLVLLLPGDREVERQLHHKYAARHLLGEWFDSYVLGSHGICPRCSRPLFQDHEVNGSWARCGVGDEMILVSINRSVLGMPMPARRPRTSGIRYVTPWSAFA